MGLSEREQQLLDELERSLADSPAAKRTRKLAKENVSSKRIIGGSVILVAGISVLLAGVMNRVMGLGVVGFVIMAGGAYLAASTKPSK